MRPPCCGHAEASGEEEEEDQLKNGLKGDVNTEQTALTHEPTTEWNILPT